MKSCLRYTACVALLTLVSNSANAALVDIGGGLIYDNVLDITWAQPDASRNWDAGNAWAAGLTLGGVSGWRLPYISVTAGVGPFTGAPVDCSTATELACRDNEMGYMLYQNLSGTASSSLFPTLDSNFPMAYWSATEGVNQAMTELGWYFSFFDGDQSTDPKFDLRSTWAVHAGDVSAIPVPAAVWLFGSGLFGLAGMARCKRAA